MQSLACLDVFRARQFQERLLPSMALRKAGIHVSKEFSTVQGIGKNGEKLCYLRFDEKNTQEK
jgi:hypothetical protein